MKTFAVVMKVTGYAAGTVQANSEEEAREIVETGDVSNATLIEWSFDELDEITEE